MLRELPLDLLLIVVSVFGFLMLKRLLLSDGRGPTQVTGHPLRGGFTRGP